MKQQLACLEQELKERETIEFAYWYKITKINPQSTFYFKFLKEKNNIQKVSIIKCWQSLSVATSLCSKEKALKEIGRAVPISQQVAVYLEQILANYEKI